MTPRDATATTAARFRRARLVVGAPGSAPTGIQEAFVDEVRRLKSGDALRPITVLVGGNYLRQHLSRLLAVRLGGHAAIRFELLKDIARGLGAAALVDRGRRALPRFGRDLLLREAITGNSHGSYFKDIASREGFLEALGATVRDLKEAGLDPVSLRAAAASRRKGSHREQGDDLSAGKLEDLADLFEAYDDLLRDRRFYDDEDLMRSAAKAAGAAAASAVNPGDRADSTILVYGFYDATWSQRQLIQESLAYRESVVFFPFESGDTEGAYDYAVPMLEWFAGWIPRRDDLPAPGASAAGEGRQPEVRFLSAPGEVRESVEATRWLLSLARGSSFPFGEMGVVYRSADPYARLLAEVMTQAGGVPRFLSEGRPLSGTPAARAMRLLLRVLEEGFSRRCVIEFLSVTCRSTDEHAGTCDEWDRTSRHAGVVKGIDDWRRRLGQAQSRATLRRSASDLLRKVEELHAGLESLPREGRWRDMAEACIGLLRRFVPPDPSIAPVEECLESLGALDEISSPVDLERFMPLLKRALDESVTRREEESGFQRSGIFVGNVMEARLLSFHALAIVGLVERTFPAPPRQDPILLDDERESVNRAVGGARMALKSHRADEERLLFRLACAAATDNLLLSYPRLEPATARRRIPSPFLLRIARRLEGRPVDYEGLERLGRMTQVRLGDLAPDEPAQAILSREFDLSALQAGPRDPVMRRRVASYLHANPILHRAMEAEEARWGEQRFTAFDGVILRPNILEALRSSHPVRDAVVSASGIESYASCPLAYFMKEVLEITAMDEPEDQQRLDPKRRGILVHRILFELFTALKGRGQLPITRLNQPAAQTLLREVAEHCFGALEKFGMTGSPMLWEVDKEQILDDLAVLVSAEAMEPASGPGAPRWMPSHFEIRYGAPPRGGATAGEDPASTTEPVVFEIGRGRVARLKGQIDRIDVAADGTRVRVTDYKTGSMTGLKENSLAGGTSVQLPLYMLAAETLLASVSPGASASEARYLSVDRKGRFKAVAFTAEALTEQREDLARIVSTFVNGVAAGVYFAYPEAAMCRHCDYRLACGEGREARFARKRADHTAADYLRMREEGQ